MPLSFEISKIADEAFHIHLTFQIALTDLGVAKHIETTKSNTKKVGTVRWRAPEVIEVKNEGESQRYGHKADVYAFGLIALFILGIPIPREAPSPDEWITFKLHEISKTHKLFQVSKRDKHIHAVVKKCLERRPTDRICKDELLSEISACCMERCNRPSMKENDHEPLERQCGGKY